MKKRMEPIEIEAKDGQIFLCQYNAGPDNEDAIITLDPSQIPTVIQWLQEAAKAAEATTEEPPAKQTFSISVAAGSKVTEAGQSEKASREIIDIG